MHIYTRLTDSKMFLLERRETQYLLNKGQVGKNPTSKDITQRQEQDSRFSPSGGDLYLGTQLLKHFSKFPSESR